MNVLRKQDWRWLFKVHSDAKNTLTKELVIAAGQHINYQRHRRRIEVWTFTEGQGDLILDDKVIRVSGATWR